MRFKVLLLSVFLFVGCHSKTPIRPSSATLPPASVEDDEGKEVVENVEFDNWPLLFKYAILECRNGNEIVFTAENVTYALNEAAINSGKYIYPGDDTRSENPDGTYKDLSPLIVRGAKLCKS